MSEMISELGSLIESKQEDSVLSSQVSNNELVIEAIPSKIVNLIDCKDESKFTIFYFN